MMHYLERRWNQGFVDRLRGSSLNTCYRWACARRWMPPDDGMPGGWYDGTDYPWVKEISNSRAKENWVMKGAQLGLTETGINRAFFELDYHRKDVMYLMPTDRSAMTMSKTRFANVIKLSPYLKSRIVDSQEVKQLDTSSLFIRGANGDINVKSTPVSTLVLDEVDEMEERQLWLALERLAGHTHKLVWGMSTPTYPEHGIHKLYLRSTQEHFFFKCPHCGHEIELRWPDSFQVYGAHVDDPETGRSFIKCYRGECQGVLPHEHKRLWLGPTAHWKATAIDADPEVRGFTLNQMYSPKVTPKEFAKKYVRGRGDEAARREFHNSAAGMPYVEDGSQVNDVHISNCIKDYGLEQSIPKPGDQSVITLGIDQGGFHHWTAVRWKLRNIAGDANDKAVGRLIGCGQILQDDWDEGLRRLMRMYQVKMAVIDYFPDQTSARRFARYFPGYVHLCQYVLGRGSREISIFEDEYGANTCKVDRAGWISKALGRIMVGEMEFPADLPWEVRRQLKNLIREHKRGTDGNFVADYVRLADDHYAHALTYAEIALNIYDPRIDSAIITNVRG